MTQNEQDDGFFSKFKIPALMNMCISRRTDDEILIKRKPDRERQTTTFGGEIIIHDSRSTRGHPVSDEIPDFLENEDEIIASVVGSLNPIFGSPMSTEQRKDDRLSPPPNVEFTSSHPSPPHFSTNGSNMSDVDEKDAAAHHSAFSNAHSNSVAKSQLHDVNQSVDNSDQPAIYPSHGLPSAPSLFSHQSGFQTPALNDYTSFALCHLEDHRQKLLQKDELARRGQEIPGGWDRKAAMAGLADLMIDAAAACRSDDPNASGFALCCNENGLKLWKKEFGLGRMVMRAEWYVPMKPKLYCSYASDHRYRHEWDSNTSEMRCLEVISPFVDIAYIATKRIATIFPRDMINLKTRRPLTYDEEDGPYGTASCSIAHASCPELKDKVRMELKLGSYAAIPIKTPDGIWAKICLFQEGDVKGWIPSSVSQMVAMKIVPRSTDKICRGALNHHGVDWKAEGCNTAYEYAWKKIMKWIDTGMMKESDIATNCNWKELQEIKAKQQKQHV